MIGPAEVRDRRPVHAKPVRWPGRVWRLCKRNGTLTSVAVAAVLLLALLDFWSAFKLLKDRQEQVLKSHAYTAQSVARTFDQRLQFATVRGLVHGETKV